MKTYAAFGLSISSDVELRSLAALDDAGLVAGQLGSVQVKLGAASDPAARPPIEADGWFEFLEGRHRFGWAELGVVEIVDGQVITAWPRQHAAEGLLEHVLLGPVIADVLLTRGSLPLHASANHVGQGAVAFVGQSGRGKSTLAAALHAHGHQCCGDDLVAVPCAGEPLVHFGISRIKLNADSAVATGANPQELPHVYTGIEKLAKPLAAPERRDPRPLRAIYRILDAERLDIVEVPPERALFELLPNCFRVEVEQHAYGIGELMRRCAAVLDRVPLFELRRPRDYARLPSLVAAVTEHALALRGTAALP